MIKFILELTFCLGTACSSIELSVIEPNGVSCLETGYHLSVLLTDSFEDGAWPYLITCKPEKGKHLQIVNPRRNPL